MVDAGSYLRAQQGKLVIMDEIHRAPGVFEVLRGIIDDNRRAGQGSAADSFFCLARPPWT